MATPTPTDKRPFVTSLLFSTSKYSDLTITCQGKNFQVHRCIVGSQSKPLASTIDRKWKESQTNTIDLSDDEPEVVEKMLHYMYNADYADEVGIITTIKPDTKTSNPSTSSHQAAAKAILLNAQVYLIAEKYDMQDLKEIARAKYEHKVTSSDGWNSTYFVESLQLLYEELPEADRFMRKLAFDTAGAHMEELLDRREFALLLDNNRYMGRKVMMASTSKSGKK